METDGGEISPNAVLIDDSLESRYDGRETSPMGKLLWNNLKFMADLLYLSLISIGIWMVTLTADPWRIPALLLLPLTLVFLHWLLQWFIVVFLFVWFLYWLYNMMTS